MTLLRRFGWVLWAPRRLFSALADSPARAEGMAAMAVLGVLWAALCFALYAAGHAPSVTLVPLPKADYYLYQALFVLPLLLVLWWLLSSVANRLCGPGDEDARAATAAALGYVYAAPMALAFVVPDILIFAFVGHAAMGRWLRYYAAVGPLLVWGLGAIALHDLRRVSAARSIAVMFVALLVQALIGGVLLR